MLWSLVWVNSLKLKSRDILLDYASEIKWALALQLTCSSWRFCFSSIWLGAFGLSKELYLVMWFAVGVLWFLRSFCMFRLSFHHFFLLHQYGDFSLSCFFSGCCEKLFEKKWYNNNGRRICQKGSLRHCLCNKLYFM